MAMTHHWSMTALLYARTNPPMGALMTVVVVRVAVLAIAHQTVIAGGIPQYVMRQRIVVARRKITKLSKPRIQFVPMGGVFAILFKKATLSTAQNTFLQRCNIAVNFRTTPVPTRFGSHKPIVHCLIPVWDITLWNTARILPIQSARGMLYNQPSAAEVVQNASLVLPGCPFRLL